MLHAVEDHIKYIQITPKTLKAAAEWIKAIIKSERFQDYLSESCIKWQFNLSRATWWGGPFERMVGFPCWESKPEMERTGGNTSGH